MKTHTYDIYIKFLYIYIKLCLFSKKLQLETDSSESKICCMRNSDAEFENYPCFFFFLDSNFFKFFLLSWF